MFGWLSTWTDAEQTGQQTQQGPAQTEQSGQTHTEKLVIFALHEFHETRHSVTFVVLVNSHQRCELTLALWCHSIIWSLFSENMM